MLPKLQEHFWKKYAQTAFENDTLHYTDSKNPLVIPSSVTYIDRYAFGLYGDFNKDLLYIKFMGTREQFDKLGTDWHWEGRYIKPKDEY